MHITTRSNSFRLKNASTGRVNAPFSSTLERDMDSTFNLFSLYSSWSIPVMFWSFPVYILMQIVALIEMKGGWRIVAFLPVIPMIYITVVTIIGYSEGSNLWPIMLLLTSPAAFLYMCVFFILFGIVKTINKKRSNKAFEFAHKNRGPDADKLRRSI